jgi:hypothetical protein
MGFFDSIPELPPREPVREPNLGWLPSDAVIAGAMPGGLLLLRTEDVAVSIGGIYAYPNGFEFYVHVRMRGSYKDDAQVWGDPFGFGRHGPSTGAGLRFGVLFADGRRGAMGQDHLTVVAHREGVVVTRHGGGSGTPWRWDAKLWVHPLPPDGPVRLVADWPALGVAETHVELDGTAIRAAAARAVVLWPEPKISHGLPSWGSSSIVAHKVFDVDEEPESEAEPDDPTPPMTMT